MKASASCLIGFLLFISASTNVVQAQPKPQTTTTIVTDKKYGEDGTLETTSDEKLKVLKEVWKDKEKNVRETHSYHTLKPGEVAATDIWKFYKLGDAPDHPSLTITFDEKHGIVHTTTGYSQMDGATKLQVEQWVQKVETEFSRDGTLPTPWKEVQTTVEQPPVYKQPKETNPESKPEDPKKEEPPKKDEPPKTDKTSTGESGGNTASTMPTFTAPGYGVEFKFENGLIRVHETTPVGGITVNLPADVQPGNIFSGTFWLDPVGKDDAERSKNVLKLEDYSFKLQNGLEIKLPATEDSGRWWSEGKLRPMGPAEYSGKEVFEMLFNGQPVTRTQITGAEVAPQQTQFTIPTGGQQGGFLTIPGPFDGSVSKTDFVEIGGERIPIIAESQRSRVVWNTSKNNGNIEVGESGRTGRCPFHNVSVSLSTNAPIHLLRGQTADVTVTFSGLGQLNQDVQYLLVNHSPGVVHMTGGTESQTKIIPQIKVVDVNGAQGGTFTDTVSITGVAPGSFVITATVLWKETCNLPLNARH